MLEIKKEGIILTKSHLEFENNAVLNPAIYREGDYVHVFYRAVENGNYSTIGYCKLEGPLKVVERWAKPIIQRELEFEKHGVEDPRIVKIEDTFYLSYCAFDGVNARGALATSKDLLHFKKEGIIVPPITYAKFVTYVEAEGKIDENYYLNKNFYYRESDPEKKILLWDKNVIFFPRKIKGNFVFMHRIRPGVQLVSVKSLEDLTPKFWDHYFIHFHDHIILDPLYEHESSYIGGGCPPIETEFGWVFIYHGVEETEKGIIYSACAAALLDLENPQKKIARLPHVLFTPEFEWELKGEVNNVVFPTGTALFGDTLYIYYGAADSCIACVSLSLTALIAELLTHRVE
jgi:beta-1,2-mannobiose phosphorylase / 1,2-beta-oligomannan phosphorylase